MTGKQLRLVAILLGVAVLLYVPRLFRDDGSGGSLDIEDGFEFVVSDSISRVDVVQADGADTLRLERTADGWTVDGYVADEVKVADLLGVLAEISSTVLVARNPTNHAAMGVADSGRRVEVYTETGGPFAFHLGERDPRSGGYFVRAPGTDPVFRLEGPVGGYVGREPSGWRPRRIAAVNTADMREIVVRRDGREAVLRWAEEGWTVAGEPADSAAMAGLLALLPSLSVTGFPSEEEEAAADFSLADSSLDIFSADDGDVTGRRLVLALRFLRDEDRGDWLVRRADGSEVFRLAQFTTNRLLPEALIP